LVWVEASALRFRRKKYVPPPHIPVISDETRAEWAAQTEYFKKRWEYLMSPQHFDDLLVELQKKSHAPIKPPWED